MECKLVVGNCVNESFKSPTSFLKGWEEGGCRAVTVPVVLILYEEVLPLCHTLGEKNSTPCLVFVSRTSLTYTMSCNSHGY